MKLFSALAWLNALRSRRATRRDDLDPAEMGTAFGLDSITLLDESPRSGWPEETLAPWEQRLAGRSRL